MNGRWRGRRRRVAAREQLRAAHEVLWGCGMNGFAERAARELSATGETRRVPTPDAVEQRYRLRKVFVKLGISSRAELKTALADLD